MFLSKRPAQELNSLSSLISSVFFLHLNKYPVKLGIPVFSCPHVGVPMCGPVVVCGVLVHADNGARWVIQLTLMQVPEG